MKLSSLTKFTGLIAATFFSQITDAQEKTDITVDINKEDPNVWYNQPWVWIIGAAVFILLLVAFLRGSGGQKKD